MLFNYDSNVTRLLPLWIVLMVLGVLCFPVAATGVRCHEPTGPAAVTEAQRLEQAQPPGQPNAAIICTYPIQKNTEIYNKNTEMYNKNTELEISSWNVLDLLRSEVAYIGSEPILPSKRSLVFLIIGVSRV